MVHDIIVSKYHNNEIIKNAKPINILKTSFIFLPTESIDFTKTRALHNNNETYIIL
jgi:hypothetical protein